MLVKKTNDFGNPLKTNRSLFATLPAILKNVKNSKEFILDAFGASNKKRGKYCLYGDTKITLRPGTADYKILSDIWFRNHYGRHGFNDENSSIILDIGAHIGLFSILAAKTAKNARIYSFEPVSENYKLLSENVAQNQLQSQIRCFNLAVANSSGYRQLHVAGDHTGGHSIARIPFLIKRTESVPTISLKDIFEKNSLAYCDLLKIDAEGAEHEILSSTPDRVLTKINRIVMEAHKTSKYDSKTLEVFLLRHGFQLKRFSSDILYAERKQSIGGSHEN